MTYVLARVAAAVFFPIGGPIVKLVTWGRCPRKGMWFKDTPESNWTIGAGVAVLVIAMMVALQQFQML